MAEAAASNESLAGGVVRQFRTLSSVLMNRLNWANAAGITFGGRRDLYQILGWQRTLTYWNYRDRYARDGVAKAVVEAYPNATWRGGVEVFEDEDPDKDTEFEKAFKDIEDRLGFWQTLQQVDILAGLSTYAVLLLGVSGDGNLAQELPKGGELLFMKPFSGGGGPNASSRQSNAGYDASVSIARYVTDPSDGRFGEPEAYYIKPTTPGVTFLNREVHWSRVIHIAEGCLEDNVFGIPTLESVFNLFDDLAKVTGGGAEAHWLRANQGLHLDVDKDMGLPAPAGSAASATVPGMTADQVSKMRDRAEELVHQQARVIVTRGVTATQLGSDVANFGPNADAILKQIAGSKGIPMRILTGSEMGTLASEQDAANFDSRVQDRRTGYAGPKIVRRTVDRLIKYGYLPTPVGYSVGWPVEENMDEKGKADFAVSLANTNKTQGSVVFTDDEIRDMSFDMRPLDPAVKQKLADEAAAKVQQAQEAMGGAEPVANTPELKAALRALETAIENNDASEVARLLDLQDGPHKFSTTQVQLPASFLAFGLTIPDADLAEAGRETDPHVTLKYGLHTNNADDVRAVLAQRGPISLTLGKLGYFETPDGDALYVSVKSEDLKRLNKLVSSKLEVTTTHPDYLPHATVAYLKPGLGGNYVRQESLFEGRTFKVHEVTFSSADGERTAIDVG